MAILTQGINDPFSGKVGTVIGSSWRGIKYMRSKGESTKKPSLAQLQQRARFALVSKFMYALKPVVMQGFDLGIAKTGLNLGLSYNMRHAVRGEHPNFELEYSQVLISKGDLPGVPNLACNVAGQGQVEWTWDQAERAGIAKPGDLVLGVAYCPALQQACFSMGNARRDDGKLVLDVRQFAGQTVQTWLGFMSADGREKSNSVYTGALVL